MDAYVRNRYSDDKVMPSTLDNFRPPHREGSFQLAQGPIDSLGYADFIEAAK